MTHSSEQPKNVEQKPRLHLAFGTGGHESEYVLSSSDLESMPAALAEQLKGVLGEDWEILYRDSKIEIGHRKEFGKRDDEMVRAAVEHAMGNEYKWYPPQT